MVLFDVCFVVSIMCCLFLMFAFLMMFNVVACDFWGLVSSRFVHVCFLAFALHFL